MWSKKDLPLLGHSTFGLPLIISGPSGVGKTTLVRRLLKEFPELVQSISVTTRPSREGEVDGDHYVFVSRDEFIRRQAQGDFLEHAELFGNLYGTSRTWVEEKLQAGKHVVLVIDTQGASSIRAQADVPSVFIRPPTIEDLRTRLAERYTETPEAIDARIELAEREIAESENYDYVLVNDDLDSAYAVLCSIFVAETHRSRSGQVFARSQTESEK